jgi:glycosyltransferase involved in cell wall biosynthesis
VEPEAVSVVIPTYNRAALLPSAVQSVLAATDAGDEIIVVDDGSTDQTASVAAGFDRRVRYLRLTNGGAGRARNAGVCAASHDLVAFADSDDLWLAHRLVWQRPWMSAYRDCTFSFTDFGQLLQDGTVVPHWARQWHQDGRSWDEILGAGQAFSALLPLPRGAADVRTHTGSLYERELYANYVNVNTLMVRRSVAGQSLHFSEDLPTFEDWECLARLSRNGRCTYMDHDTALQRAHDGPRLTGLNDAKIPARLRMIGRNWAADSDFMRSHEAQVASLLAQLRRTRARQLLRVGRAAEARRLVAGTREAWPEQLASLVPHGIYAMALGVRRLFRGPD